MKRLQQLLTTALPVWCVVLMLPVFLPQFALAQELRWEQVNIPSNATTCLTVSGNTIFAGTVDGVYRSIDNGISWTSLGLRSLFYSLFATGNSIFAGTYFGSIYRSTDGGNSWTQVNTGLSDTEYITAFTLNGGALFAGTGRRGIFRSTDNGTTWTPVNTELPYQSVWSLAVSGGSIFAGTYLGGVYRSTNNGTSWTEASNGLFPRFVSSFAVSGNTIFAGTQPVVELPGSRGSVYRSTDNGMSWTRVNKGLVTFGVTALAMSGGTLFAGTMFEGVYRSTDNGDTWTEMNTGLNNKAIYSLTVKDNTLFAIAGLAGGPVFRASLSPQTSVAQPRSLQNSTAEHLTFAPQPASERTRVVIASRAAINSAVLTVSDILGRQILHMEGVQILSGLNDVDVDVRTLAVGAYLVRVQAGEQVFVGMLHVVR